jgi:site-specific DNA recombinase
MTRLRAVCYPRVSSLAQQDRHTIDSQLSVLPSFIERLGFELVAPADTYVDDGRSAKAGALDKREGFQRLLADMKAGKFDVVAVVDQDRLTRSEDLAERGFIYGAFQAAGVQIAVASTGQLLDLRSSQGDLLSSLGAFFSAEENRKRRERTVRGKVEAIRQGRKPAGPTPFGLLYNKETRAWSIDPELGPVVLELCQRIVAGESCEQIAIDFAKRQIPKCRPSKSGKRKPGVWNRERVWQIAVARTCIGKWVADKKRKLVVEVPAIVPVALWNQVQEVLGKHQKRGLRKSKHIYLLEEIAVCGVCQAQVGCMPIKNGRGELVLYYLCCRRRRAHWGTKRCSLPYLQAHDVDERFWNAFSALLAKPKAVEQIIAQRATRAHQDGGHWVKDVATYKTKLERLERAEAAMLKRFTAGAISEKAMDGQLDDIGRQRRLLQQQVEVGERQAQQAGRQRVQVEGLLAVLDKLRAKLKTATPETKRQLVRALLPGGEYHAVVQPDGKVHARLAVSTGASIAPVLAAG